MSETYLMIGPIVINSLAAEMIYILCSRLKAQSISKEKSSKVIRDITLAIYNKQFQDELYVHKILGKHSDIRKIFEQLAHASIMRLNSTSMSKLFELMLMTIKLQFVRTRTFEEIYQVCVNHYEGVLIILREHGEDANKELITLVSDELKRFKDIYGQLNTFDYFIIKASVLRFLQGKNVKVSIFIQDGLQETNSILFLPMNEESAPTFKKPGKITDYTSNKDTFVVLKNTEFYMGNKGASRLFGVETELGKNMYTDTKLKIVGRAKKKEEEKKVIDRTDEYKKEIVEKKMGVDETYTDTASDTTNIFNRNEMKNNKKNEFLSDEQLNKVSKGVRNDFNDLSNLIKTNTSPELFNFDLFGEENNKNGEKSEDIIIVERAGNTIKNKYDQEFLGIKGEEDNGDDLLDLMDKNV